MEEYLRDILECEKTLGNSKFFRPPYGRINFKAIPHLSQFKIIMWDVLSRDYLPKLDCTGSLKRMKQKTENGSIIVFHDSEKAEKNMKMMLPEFLTYLKNEGYLMRAL